MNNALKQSIWIFTILIALAGSGWYFASAPRAAQLDPQTLANTEDTFVSNVLVSQFNEQGRLINRMSSPLLKHIPNGNTHLLTKPFITVVQDNQAAWQIRSMQATAINGGEQITFEKQVVIHQDAGEHNQENTFKTSKLLYYPKQKFATTKSKVLFVQPGSTVNAKGMNAWLSDKHVQLLSKTRITYEPKHA